MAVTFGTRLKAMMKQEVSAADIEGLLRGSGQLEDLRQQIDDARRAGEIAHPGRPLEIHGNLGGALAYFWVAQAFIAVAQNLKEADDAIDPETRGYMPRVSHDQAMALLVQVGDYLALTSAALVDPTYAVGRPLPVPLQPRIEAQGRCPVGHLKGMLQAARYLDGYAEVEVERYATAVKAASGVPEEVAVAAQRLTGELAAARSRLAMATGTVLPILNGQTVDATTHEAAETNLWTCLSAYVWFGQIVAIPSLLRRQNMPAPPPQVEPGGYGQSSRPPADFYHVSPRERWLLTAESARAQLHADGRTHWAEDELEEMWQRKNWRLSPEEQRFLTETADLQRQGAISGGSYLLECPFNPVWVARRPVTVLGQSLPPGSQFAYNHHEGRGNLITGFRQGNQFEECEDNGRG